MLFLLQCTMNMIDHMYVKCIDITILSFVKREFHFGCVSGEQTCPGFLCKDGGCVAQSALCDNTPDCRDGSDELEDTCGKSYGKDDTCHVGWAQVTHGTNCSERQCVKCTFLYPSDFLTASHNPKHNGPHSLSLCTNANFA